MKRKYVYGVATTHQPRDLNVAASLVLVRNEIDHITPSTVVVKYPPNPATGCQIECDIQNVSFSPGEAVAKFVEHRRMCAESWSRQAAKALAEITEAQSALLDWEHLVL